ncbi:MAG: Gfo/Idh/MocA family oxidoreductase [Gemmataceae bacterium]
MFVPNRRNFLFDAGWLTTTFATTGLMTSATRGDEPKPIKAANGASPNNRLRVGIIGARSTKLPGLNNIGRGMDHVKFVAGRNECEVVTICDCDESVVGTAMSQAEKQQGRLPKYEKDLRKVIDDPTIDIITIATPNHWHALAAIWALRAGKHVYVEKPVSHNVWEGRRIVEAARHYKRLCQTGTQCRSMTSNIEAVEFMRSGKIGEIKIARGLCYKPRASIGKVGGDGEIPTTVDYDLWCGPAPKRPPQRTKLHYDWHWQWDFGNGDFGNQGIHQVDVARWGLGKKGMPKSVMSLGGRFGYSDDGQTANTQVSIFDYGDAKLIFEVRGLMTQDVLADVSGKTTTNEKTRVLVGNVFYGTDGMVVCTNYEKGVAVSKDGEIIRTFLAKNDDDHFGNFAAAVRANDASLLRADIEEGHLSSSLCHLGNISLRLGREVALGSADVKSCAPDVDSSETVERMVRHLAKNGINLDDVKCRVGPRLEIDGKTETLVGNASANQMLAREYRKGFEGPARF